MGVREAIIGEGRYEIKLTLFHTQEGIILHLLGGEKKHVGGTVTCVPRPKKNGEGFTVDSWVTPVPGHKDTEAAKLVAEIVARATNQVVVCVAGVHIAKAQKEEIAILMDNCLEAARQIMSI